MKLHIVHTNDLHNHFPESTLKKLAGSDSLLLDSGDAITGSNITFRLQGEPILARMRAAGYAAMALGNREFHYVRKIVAARRRAAGFPMLAANLVDLQGKLTVSDRIVIEREGLKIGIFGLTNPQYPPGSPWEKITGWRFLPPLEAARTALKMLQNERCSFLLCLSHLGFWSDQRLAESVEGIHAILGGHSHTILPQPFMKNGTAILQGGAYGRFVGNWELSVETDGGKAGACTVTGELVRSDDD